MAASWPSGASRTPTARDAFSPHSVAVDSHGDIYVGQVTYSYTKRQAPPGSKVLRKYVRQ